jgi:DNA-binding transcriptional ArsR family regulator
VHAPCHEPRIGVTRQGISQHLDVLESSGLIATARQGRYKLHYLRTEPLQQIAIRWLRKHKTKGDRE